MLRFDGLVVATGLRPRRCPSPGRRAQAAAGTWCARLVDCHDAVALRMRAAWPPARAARASSSSAAGSSAARSPRTALALGCAGHRFVEPDRAAMARVLGPELASAIQRFARAAQASPSSPPRARRLHRSGPRLRLLLADGVNPAFLPAAPRRAVPLSTAPFSPPTSSSSPSARCPTPAGLTATGLDLVRRLLLRLPRCPPRQGRHAPRSRSATSPASPTRCSTTVPRRVEHWSMPTDTARRAAATLRAPVAATPWTLNRSGRCPPSGATSGDLRLQSYGCPGSPMTSRDRRGRSAASQAAACSPPTTAAAGLSAASRSTCHQASTPERK